ncbi:MAG: DnaJ domain-containing protein [Actinomycetota bacterium]|nr:DnaJ domain-containing protein [Actinomycetota bacterium]
MTHYEVLGVEPSASGEEIRRAYVRLARQHHPDYFGAAAADERLAAEQRMRTINEAWNVLGDRARRHDYDRSQGLAEPPDGDGGRGFQPFDTDEDDIDPRDLPDAPYRRDPVMESPLTRVLTLAPVASFAVSVALAAVGMVVGSLAVLGLALAAFLLACLGFVVIPLLALSRASRDD